MRFRLKRRGVEHGSFEHSAGATRFVDRRPELLRGFVKPTRGSIDLIDKLRRGGELVDLIPRLRGFNVLGTSINTQDPLELHKLHVASAGRELYLKVNWLSTYPGDGSLRIRGSFGAEILDDWLDDPTAARAAERLFEKVFPETTHVTRNRKLIAAIRSRIRSTPRFVQRILYSNAPNGGALFHHDYVPRQIGVCYAQLAGSTGWLTLPENELARFGALDREKLINHTPSFTRRLVEAGWFFVVKPGDVMLLPSFSQQTTAWHSVFTLGPGDNLALSFGLARRK